MSDAAPKRLPDLDRTGQRLEERRMAATEIGLLAGGMTLFVLLLYQMQDFLNPLLVSAAALILLWPLREYRGVRTLLLAGGFLLLMWLLQALRLVLAPFVLAALVAYLFNPLVGHLYTRWRIPRWASSLVVTLLVVGLVMAFMLMLVPSLVGQIGTLAQRVLDGLGDLRGWLQHTTLLDQLEAAGLVEKEELITEVTALIQERATLMATSIPNAAQGLVRSLRSVIGVITLMALIPVALYYILRDYLSLRAEAVQLMPTLGGRRDYLLEVSAVVGSYIRGQLLISAIAATFVSVLLLLFKVPFALLIGLLTGVLNMIPRIGIIITFFIGALIGMIFGDPWLVDTVVIMAVLAVDSLLEQMVLTPNILGNKVGLHPVLILLSLFVFGYFMGILGLIIAVPATALMVTALRGYRDELTLELTHTGWHPPSFRDLWPRRRPPETDSPPPQPSHDAPPILGPDDPEVGR